MSIGGGQVGGRGAQDQPGAQDRSSCVPSIRASGDSGRAREEGGCPTDGGMGISGGLDDVV